MAKRSQIFVVTIVVVIAAVALAALLARDAMRCAGFPGAGVGVEDLPASQAAPGNLRVVAWNLRNFPIDERRAETPGFSPQVNVCDLEDALTGIDADVLALAEVCDTKRFPPLLKRAGLARDYRVLFAGHGGSLGEHVGVAWDGGRLLPWREATEIALPPATRGALAIYLRSVREGGVDLSLVSLHLDEGAGGREIRLAQCRALVEWLNRWVEEVADEDLIVTGTFWAGEDELEAIDAILAGAGLERLDNITGCTSYEPIEGSDGAFAAALRDHVYVRSLEELDRGVPLQSWLHCARHQCGELVSEPGQEDATFFDISDHCPMSFEVRDVDDDGDLDAAHSNSS
jgi:endonuclease/exonuclease/phosphatase family metal-dependent hydrolase